MHIDTLTEINTKIDIIYIYILFSTKLYSKILMLNYNIIWYIVQLGAGPEIVLDN